MPALVSYITDLQPGVGREVIDALIAANKHEIIVLTRKVGYLIIFVANGGIVTLTSPCRMPQPMILFKASLG